MQGVPICQMQVCSYLTNACLEKGEERSATGVSSSLGRLCDDGRTEGRQWDIIWVGKRGASGMEETRRAIES